VILLSQAFFFRLLYKGKTTEKVSIVKPLVSEGFADLTTDLIGFLPNM
jgi:hypothetical protein